MGAVDRAGLLESTTVSYRVCDLLRTYSPKGALLEVQPQHADAYRYYHKRQKHEKHSKVGRDTGESFLEEMEVVHE
jgi:hypothetical protein